MKRAILLLLVCFLLVSCNLSPEWQAAMTATAQTATAFMWTKTFTPTFTPTSTATSTFTPAFTFTPTDTPTITPTLTDTPTPTFTQTLTFTLTPTFSFPLATVKTEQAPCMYGPSMEYLWKYGLKKGDTGKVKGRSPYNSWLYVQMDEYRYNGQNIYCWIPGSQLDVVGDVKTVAVQQVYLYMSQTGFYSNPPWVEVKRDGDTVTIWWGEVWMTEDDDRGYFLDLMVCQNGFMTWVPKHLPTQHDTEFTVEDDANCSQNSGGMLYAVEKHGYIPPGIKIDWPK